jgi:O-glycosyl hydrolase
LHSKKVAIVAEQSLPAQIELRIANNTIKVALAPRSVTTFVATVSE